MFKPVTYLSRQVNDTNRVIEHLHDAFRMALSGKRGPVFLCIPRDILDDQFIDQDITTPRQYRCVDNRIQGDAQTIKRAAEIASAGTAAAVVGGRRRRRLRSRRGGGGAGRDAGYGAGAWVRPQRCGSQQPPSIHRSSRQAWFGRSAGSDTPRRRDPRAGFAPEPGYDAAGTTASSTRRRASCRWTSTSRRSDATIR